MLEQRYRTFSFDPAGESPTEVYSPESQSDFHLRNLKMPYDLSKKRPKIHLTEH
jgi:hypothetical protein